MQTSNSQSILPRYAASNKSGLGDIFSHHLRFSYLAPIHVVSKLFISEINVDKSRNHS